MFQLRLRLEASLSDRAINEKRDVGITPSIDHYDRMINKNSWQTRMQLNIREDIAEFRFSRRVGLRSYYGVGT